MKKIYALFGCSVLPALLIIPARANTIVNTRQEYLGYLEDNLIRDRTFKSVNSYGQNGGAVYRSGPNLYIQTSIFTHNMAQNGGGLYSTGNAGKVIFQVNEAFSNNTAAQNGGAIYNDSDASVEIQGDFSAINNSATNGGAIYTAGGISTEVGYSNRDVTFSGNRAYDKGGAIYISDTGWLRIGKGRYHFTNNVANGIANDIHNDGYLYVIANHNTSVVDMDGGITGNGIFSIDGSNGSATLNLGTSHIHQDKLLMNSCTVNGELRNENDFLTFDIATEFSGTGFLNLTLKGAGEYNIFKNLVFPTMSINIADTSVFSYSWNNTGDTLIVTYKPINDIVSESNIDAKTANVLLSLMASDKENARSIGHILDVALVNGRSDYVQNEIIKIAPQDKPVAQSVATSVQNVVSTLATNRMSSHSIGRNGGDVDLTAVGAWARGIYNQTELKDEFEGNTIGMSAGFDGTLNRHTTIGAGYAFNHSDISSNRDTDIDSHTVFIYGQYKPTNWYVNAMLNYTMSDYSESGTVAETPVVSKYKIDSFGGQVASGYDFISGITPEIALRYLHIGGTEYTNSMGIKNELKSSDYLTAILGTKYGYDFVANNNLTFRPEISGAIKYDVMSDKVSSTVMMPGISAYTISGDNLSRFGGEVGVGLTMKYSGLDLSLGYDVELRKDYTSRTAMLKARYTF